MFTDYYPERKSIRALLFNKGSEMLFHGVQRTGRTPFFTTFGGGVEGDESPEETLHRELYEELDAEAVIGREVLALPGHRYFIARVTKLGPKPFTHGPEFQDTKDQRFWVEHTRFARSYSRDFNLQPKLLKYFIRDYSKIILKELERIS